MKKSFVIFLPILVLCLYCVPLDQSNSDQDTGKVLVYDDHSYENNIKTILLYPFKGNLEDEIKPAALTINQDGPLLLAFDQLNADYEDLKVKIIHCDRNWQKSILNDNEYLFAYNEFPIKDYEFSFNTRTPYTHYRFIVPKVKLTGNYLLMVYRGNNTKDLILTRRFMIFDQLVGITPQVGVSSDIANRSKNQQITLALNYRNIEVLNPMEDIKIVIRQNQRWDNAITNLKPTFARESEKILEYNHYDLTNNFMGGNEFRFFDLRTINASGQNIANLRKNTNRVDAFIMKDKDRGSEVYAQLNDINGNFVINNLESSPPNITAEYVYVHFYLATTNKISQGVHISGSLTNWEFNKNNLMEYDETLKGYTGSLLLKQGWYNYIYYVPESGQNPYAYEGSHYETENQYEFIVYFRPPGSRADQIIGYLNHQF